MIVTTKMSGLISPFSSGISAKIVPFEITEFEKAYA